MMIFLASNCVINYNIIEKTHTLKLQLFSNETRDHVRNYMKGKNVLKNRRCQLIGTVLSPPSN